jgi:polyvinyl alcohol dehydrogenase (cytochrome)
MRTGAIVWARQTGGPDVWTTECFKADNDCIDNYDVDYDFGQAPMMFTASGIDVVGVGQKSGFFYALNRGNGAIVWSKSTGPGNSGGGIIWGSAVDNSKVYIGNVNAGRDTFKFKSGESCSGGFWTALNKNTGATVWQTCDPIASPAYVASVDHSIPTLQTGRNLAYYAQAFGPVTVTPGGVLFGGSLDPRGTIYGFNVADGSIVWTDFVGGSIGSGACLTGRYLFQGGGYSKWNKGISSNKFVAFALPSSVTTTVAPDACWTCPPGDVHCMFSLELLLIL